MIPAISNRTQLANELKQHDRLIFTSNVDYFPLTVAEALVAGLSVLALDSGAAQEFASLGPVEICTNTADLVAAAERPHP